MIEIVEISIQGATPSRSFRGSISFQRGLQVVVAPNRFGKSMAFAALSWCLGVEHIFGVQSGDNTFFPVAARSHLELDGVEEPVEQSVASVLLRRDDGASLRLTRGITSEANAILYDDGTESGFLAAGRGTMANEVSGFQVRFRQWAGLPNLRLLSSAGHEVPIYLENLAPLFLIEQMLGWSDIQVEQVHRYGTLDIEEGAFEYLLGLDQRLAGRLRRQASVADAAAVREEARAIAHDLTALIEKQGWNGEFSAAGSLDALATRWAKLRLYDLFRERFSFNAAGELERLQERVDRLQSRITRGKIDSESTAETVGASTQVVALKQRRHELQLFLSTLRSQFREQKNLLGTVEGRLRSAKDLRKLKAEKIGILPKAECPTCHQVVDPVQMELSGQSVEAIDLHISQLDREAKMLASNIDTVGADITAAMVESSRIDVEFATAEHTLRMVNHTVGPARETLVRLSGELVSAERELTSLRRLVEEIDALQARISGWVLKAKLVAGLETESAPDGERLQQFVVLLGRFLAELGCAGITPEKVQEVSLDERYVPTYRGRLLRSFGSASDRARLVTAYVLALNELGGHHPRFVVLDEPLQQNPDPDHRLRFLTFLGVVAATITHQAVVFTALSGDEIEKLQEAGAAVQVLTGRFLRAVEDPEPKSDKREGGLQDGTRAGVA